MEPTSPFARFRPSRSKSENSSVNQSPCFIENINDLEFNNEAKFLLRN